MQKTGKRHSGKVPKVTEEEYARYVERLQSGDAVKTPLPPPATTGENAKKAEKSPKTV